MPESSYPSAFLCRDDELFEGLARGFDPWGEGRDTVIALRWQGQPRAYRNSCPHWQVPMQYRKDHFMSGDRQHIVCFAHGALFLPEDGRCVLGPCVGESLQALEVKLSEDCRLWVASPEPLDAC